MILISIVYCVVVVGFYWCVFKFVGGGCWELCKMIVSVGLFVLVVEVFWFDVVIYVLF